jgi:hypothetical protein
MRTIFAIAGGPWKASTGHGGWGWKSILNANNQVIASAKHETDLHADAYATQALWARLIEKAPELYAALEGFRDAVRKQASESGMDLFSGAMREVDAHAQSLLSYVASGSCDTVKDIARSATEMPLYRRAFPDFPELDVALPAGFKDISWRHDARPGFSKTLPNGHELRLYIDYPNADDREEPAAARFYLGLYDDGQEHVRDLAITDDYNVVLKHIDTFEITVVDAG